MPDFYILNDVSPVEAENAEAAARQFAQQTGVTAGVVLVAKGAKSFDVTTEPSAINVTPTPE